MFNTLLKKWRKRSAIRSYIRKLGPLLKQRYGKQKYYTAEQVMVTAQKYALDMDYLCYGYSIYLTPQDFATLHESLGEECDYEAMRHDIALLIMGGRGEPNVSLDDLWSHGYIHPEFDSVRHLDSGGYDSD